MVRENTHSDSFRSIFLPSFWPAVQVEDEVADPGAVGLDPRHADHPHTVYPRATAIYEAPRNLARRAHRPVPPGAVLESEVLADGDPHVCGRHIIWG